MNGVNEKNFNVTSNNNISESNASVDSHSNQSSNPIFSKTNLYIKGLQQSTTDQDLYNMCSRFGQISSTKAILDSTDHVHCRGYGFVEFTSPQSAELAVKELVKSGVQAQMAKLRVDLSKNHSQNSHHNNSHNNRNHNHNFYNNNVKNEADSTNLYIANLPIDTTLVELEALLSTYGTVLSSRLLFDEGNNPKGVGFARMESREKCEQVIEQLGGRPYKGSKDPLLVKFADSAKPKKYNNHQHKHHHNQHHQNYSKLHHDDNRWIEGNVQEMNAVPMFDRRGNMSGTSRAPDAIVPQMDYSAATVADYRSGPHGFRPLPTAFSPLGPSNAAPWIHPAHAGQHYVIPQQVLPPGSMNPNQPALHYAPITQLTAQMQGLQLAHPGHVGAYMPAQQWPPAAWPQPPPLSRPPRAVAVRLPTQPQIRQQQNPLPK